MFGYVQETTTAVLEIAVVLGAAGWLGLAEANIYTAVEEEALYPIKFLASILNV